MHVSEGPKRNICFIDTNGQVAGTSERPGKTLLTLHQTEWVSPQKNASGKWSIAYHKK